LGILLAAVFAPIVLLVVICVIIKTCRWKRPPLSAPTTETASHTSSGFQMETRPPPTAPLTAMIYLRRTLLCLRKPPRDRRFKTVRSSSILKLCFYLLLILAMVIVYRRNCNAMRAVMQFMSI